MLQEAEEISRIARPARPWRRFVVLLLAAFGAVLGVIALFILLVDPYELAPFRLPLKRAVVTNAQRYAYPQLIRAHRFDSLIMGSSTSRPIDPQTLDDLLGVRFANLSMNGASALEQRTVTEYFLRKLGPPKVLLIGLDHVWCYAGDADPPSVAGAFPDWLYDDSPWSKLLPQLNTGTVELAVRLIGYQLGRYPERIRPDGFDVATRSEQQYDLAQARAAIWQRSQYAFPDMRPPQLRERKRRAMRFPALNWLDQILAQLPPSTTKVLLFTPVHVAALPWNGSRTATIEAECKVRVVAMARARGAKLIDWRIVSPFTTTDSNYWDALHYRVSAAEQVARETAVAIRENAESPNGDYRLLVR